MMPATRLKSVLLPQPEGPTIATNSPARTARSVGASASVSPNRRVEALDHELRGVSGGHRSRRCRTDGPSPAADRELPSPHGEVPAAHGTGHEFSDRRAASLEPRTTRLANSRRRRISREKTTAPSDDRTSCLGVVRASRLGYSMLIAVPRRSARGRATHHEGRAYCIHDGYDRLCRSPSTAGEGRIAHRATTSLQRSVVHYTIWHCSRPNQTRSSTLTATSPRDAKGSTAQAPHIGV